jgi:hypothetical protein
MYKCECINTIVCSRCYRETTYAKWTWNELKCPHCQEPPEVQKSLMTHDDIDDR